MLGVVPLQGRGFSPDDRESVVVSYGFRQRYLPNESNVVGHKLVINHHNFTIIGVTPREFFGDVVGSDTDLWFPIEAQPSADPGRNYLDKTNTYWLQMMGRLKPGVSLAQVSTVVNTLGISIIQDQAKQLSRPDEIAQLSKQRIQVSSGATGFSRLRHSFAPMLWILMALVALVLLICCANVANLQMARAVNRSREMGLRLAVGASRLRLLRQLLTESMLLAAGGAAAGLFFGYWLSRLLLLVSSNGKRPPLETHLNATALLFTIAISCLAVLLFGLAPAWFASKTAPASSLRETKTGRKVGAQRFEKGLVAMQIVFSLVLLYGAGLFIRTLQNLEKSDVGYRREHLLMAKLDPWAAGYKDSQIPPLAQKLALALTAIPGVHSATYSENGLFSGTESSNVNAIEGFTPRVPEDSSNRSDKVGPHYFSTVGIPLLSGREIGPQDGPATMKVAVINQAMARFYFHGNSPLGFHITDPDGANPYTIVGVVGVVKQGQLREPAQRRFYTPYLQSSNDDPVGTLNFEIRTAENPGAIESAVRQAIHQTDSALLSPTISWSQVLIEGELEQETVIAKLSSLFSILALILASVGLYGVMSYLTARRTTEVGVRLALGASRSTVIGLIFRDAFLMAAVGLTIGIACAFFIGRLASGVLYGVNAFDPLTISAASIIICFAAALASWLPAHRASRVDPMVAMRAD